MPPRTTILITVLILSAASAFARDADPSRGRRVYQRYCATCHGTDGRGRGPTAPRLQGPAPRDFTLGIYKFRSAKTNNLPTTKDLMRTTWRGVPGTAMPAFGRSLGRDDIRDVSRYIEGFSPKFAEAAREGEQPEIAPIPKVVPPADSASIARGRSLYLLLKCWDCHGVRGEGDGPSAWKAEDVKKRHIDPANLTRGVFKNGGRERDIYRTLATGLDGTPMASFFDNPTAMFGPLVLQRKQYQADLRQVEDQLDPDEVAELRRFSATLPSARQLEAMPDAGQTRLLEGWRWDLVHYVKSLSKSKPWWRSLLGL